MNRIFSYFIEKRIEIILAMSGLFLLVVFFCLLNTQNLDSELAIVVKNNDELIKVKRTKIQEELYTQIEAKSVHVIDTTTGSVIFSKNEAEKMPLASLTKLMASLVISEELPGFTSIPITQEAINILGDNGLYLNDKWKLSNLLDFSLITSSNDGFFALASVLNEYESLENLTTVDLMNRKAQELGLSQTEFFNETGLDLNNGGTGGYGSAKDTAQLVSYILKNESDLLSATAENEIRFLSESNILHIAKNTNKLIEKIPSLIASKTGFTDYAGGNLVIAFEVGPNRPIIAVVMGSSIDGRFSDMEKIVKNTFEYYSTIGI